MPYVSYPSRAGITFNFSIWWPSSTWPQGPGLYMFCRYDAARNVNVPVYIGQCDNFNSRLCGHERWAEAVRAGATRILLTGVPKQADRDSFERILIQELQPELNVMLRYPRAA